jgi:signal transduction histidine kinase
MELWLALAAVIATAIPLAVWRAFHVGRSRARTELAELRAELETARLALDEDRRQMVTTVSHELRTPLTIVQGIVNTLSTHWTKLSEPARLDLIDTIADNVASLDSSILHFIDVARLERGEVRIHVTDVPVHDVVDSVLAKLGPVLAGYSVRTQIDIDTVRADRDAVARIFELLLSNATRFSPLASSIVVRARRVDDDSIDLAVIDRGMGIAPHNIPHVFEKFWRADTGESGVSRGAGLGLAIVKSLAELHGGSVRVLSSRGRGSAFHVTLPSPQIHELSQPATSKVG